MNERIRFFQTISPRWLLLAGVLLLLWRLNYAPLWNPDEGRYASAAREMLQPFDGKPANWVVPHLNSIPRLNKPPLVYWLGALSMNVFGFHAGSVRLVSALAAIGVMWLLFVIGRRMFGERAGIASALIWATSLFPFGMARVYNTDMLLCASTALAFCGIWLSIEGGCSESKPQKYNRIPAYLLAGAGMGLALLAKGPVGMALPLLICFVYLTVARRWKFVPVGGVILALLLAVAIAAPWFYFVEQRVPGFLHRFIIEENLGRFSGKEDFHDPTPFWFYVPVLILGLLPWTAFLAPAIARLSSHKADTDAQRARLFLWLWALLLIGFFSLSSTKLVSYILPAFPALALLLGDALGQAVDDVKRAWPATTRGITIAVTLTFNLILVAVALYYLLNNRTLPRAEASPYAVAVSLIVLTQSGFLLYFWRRRNVWRMFCTQMFAAAALFCTILGVAGHIAPYEDASPMFQALKPHLKEGDRFLEYRTFQPTAIFYLQRTVPLVEFVNNSGLDESHPNFKKLYLREDAAFKRLLAEPVPTYILVRWKHRQVIKAPPQYQMVASNNDYFLLSNHPKEFPLSHDFRAPAKRNR
ncbi:MAG TPA: glycosyltransferase family 39 protein [Abditibacteriaceae bacterium]